MVKVKSSNDKSTADQLDTLLDRVDNRVAALESRLGLLADQHKGSTQKGAPAPKKGEAQKEPVMRLRGGKWIIGHFRNSTVTLTAEQLEKRHTVYVYSCRRCKIEMQGMCANLSVDMCADSEVEVEHVKRYVGKESVFSSITVVFHLHAFLHMQVTSRFVCHC
jgi:hypothetical protein